MFHRRKFNFNIDDLMARYDKIMEDFNKQDWTLILLNLLMGITNIPVM